MFDNDLFSKWLDENANTAFQKVIDGKSLESNDIIIMTLKAQTNHITHLELDLKGEILALRKDMDARFEQVDKRFEEMQRQFNGRFEEMQQQFSGRFEEMQRQSDKRFEQVDKRFEEVNHHLYALNTRMDSFMKWSITAMFAVGGLVVAAIQLLSI